MVRVFGSLMLVLASVSSFAAGNDLAVEQRRADDSAWDRRNLGTPSVNSIYSFDVATTRPVMVSLSSSLQISSGVLGLTFTPFSGSFVDLLSKPTTLAGYGITDAYPLAGNPSSFLTSATAASTYATQSSLTSGLAAKFNTPAGTTAQYVRGDGSLATLPTVASRVFNNSVSRALGTCFQVSATRDASVSYAVDITTSITLGGSPKGSAYLRYYTDSGCTTGQQTVIGGTNGFPTTLSVTVGQQLVGSVPLAGKIPAGVWARLETVIDSGSGATVTFAARPGQEVFE